MPTSIEFTQEYAADAQAVRAMLTSPDYATMRGQRTGATSITVELQSQADGSTRLDIVRVLPAEVPSFAKSFVGETLTVTECQTWHTPKADGTGSATITAAFSAPITFAGQMAIESDGSTTRVRSTGEFKANVPFVGGKVEQVAKEIFEKYLRKEQSLGQEWLAEHA